MKFGYELMLWTGVGVSLLYLLFGWPPILQPVVHALMSSLVQP